jgi:MraZ protein
VENGGKMSFFSGSYDGKLDEKGRFVLPQNMRYGLVEDGKLEFAIGLGLGGCLTIYKSSVIKKMMDKFQSKQHLVKYQKFFTLFFSTLHFTSCDKLGRINLPQRLKDTAGIGKEVVLAGVLNKIEIWPKQVYERNLKNLLEGKDPELDLAKLTEEAFELLADEKDEENDAE